MYNFQISKLNRKGFRRNKLSAKYVGLQYFMYLNKPLYTIYTNHFIDELTECEINILLNCSFYAGIREHLFGELLTTSLLNVSIDNNENFSCLC